MHSVDFGRTFPFARRPKKDKKKLTFLISSTPTSTFINQTNQTKASAPTRTSSTATPSSILTTGSP